MTPNEIAISVKGLEKSYRIDARSGTCLCRKSASDLDSGNHPRAAFKPTGRQRNMGCPCLVLRHYARGILLCDESV